MTIYDDQRVLFVRTPDRVIEIAFEGDGIKADLSEFDLGDFIEIPAAPGVYIWEGEYEYYPGGWAGTEPVEANSQWVGETRLATSADLARFGLASSGALDEARAVVSVLSAEVYAEVATSRSRARHIAICQKVAREMAARADITIADAIAMFAAIQEIERRIRGEGPTVRAMPP